MTDLFNFGLALSVAMAPESAKDQAMDAMLASFAKQRQHHWEENMRKANNVRTLAEVADEMRDNFDAGEAKSINGGMA